MTDLPFIIGIGFFVLLVGCVVWGIGEGSDE